MSRFAVRICLFALPLIIIVIGLEAYIKTSQSAYLLKAHQFKYSDYDALILGSSHNENALNPANLSLKACNAAMGSQDIRMDLALLRKSIDLGHHPRYVIAEMSYHSLRSNPENYWRNGLYEYFFDLQVSPSVNLSKYFLLVSNFKFFRKFFGAKFRLMRHEYRYNEFGFDENDFDGTFKNFNYDEKEIEETGKSRLSAKLIRGFSKETISKTEKYLNEINAICRSNNIQLVLVSPPVYRTWAHTFNKQYLDLRSKIIWQLKKDNPGLKWFNFENSEFFHAKHFKNDDHLNANGARLFAEFLSDSLSLRPRLTDRQNLGFR